MRGSSAGRRPVAASTWATRNATFKRRKRPACAPWSRYTAICARTRTGPPGAATAASSAPRICSAGSTASPAFELGDAMTLWMVIVAGIEGCVLGFVLALLWRAQGERAVRVELEVL